MHVWSCTKIFPHGKNKVDLNTASFSEESSCNTHRMFTHKLAVPCARWQLLDTTTLAGISSCFPQIKPSTCTHRDVISSWPCGHLNVSFFISSRAKLTSMMEGDKNCKFTLCKTSRIGTFHSFVHDVSSFSKQKKPLSLRSTDWKSTLRLPTSHVPNLMHKLYYCISEYKSASSDLHIHHVFAYSWQLS